MKLRTRLKRFAKQHKLENFVPLLLVTSAATTFTKALTEGLIMPFIGLLVPGGSWQTLVWSVWSLQIGVGVIASSFVNFILLCTVAYGITAAWEAKTT